MTDPTLPGQATPPEPHGAVQIIRRLGFTSVLGAATICLPPVGLLVLTTHLSTIGTWLRDRGTQGCVIYVAAFVVLSGIAIVPTHISAIVGGWAFGFGVAMPLALAGFLGGSIVSYAIVRPTASSRVEALIASKPRWKAVHDALVRGSPWRVLAIVTLVRVPATAFAATNLVLASVRVPFHLYAAGTLVGMIPRTTIVVYVASKARDLADAEKTPLWAWIVGAVATVAALAALGFIANRALRKFTGQNPPAAAQ